MNILYTNTFNVKFLSVSLQFLNILTIFKLRKELKKNIFFA